MSKLTVKEIAPLNTGIGIGGVNSQPGAILNIQSTEQGVSFPRMTTSQRNDIPSPFNGLLIYNIDVNSFEQYNGSAWEAVNGVSSINGQTNKVQIINTGAIGTAPNISQTGTNINTINIPLANQSSVTAGLISKTEYDTFNNKVSTNDNRLTTENILKVKKNPGTGEFSSIAAAIATITTSSETNKYLVEVGPGIYEEPEITIPPYVSITGSTINITTVKPIDEDQHLFIMGARTEVSFLNCVGHSLSLGSGKAAFYCQDINDFAQLHKISIYDFDIGIENNANDQDCTLYAEYVDINGDYSYAAKNISIGGNLAFLQLENFYAYGSNASTKTTILNDGETTELHLHLAGLIGVSGDDVGIRCFNGGSAEINATFLHDFGDSAIIVESSSATNLAISGSTFVNCTKNVIIDSTTATGYLDGSSEYGKIEINSSSSFFVANKDLNIITVSKRGGDFSSIKAAMDSITDASETNAYIIKVGPGVYVEDTIQGKSFTSIIGESTDAVTIEVNDVNKHVILGAASFNLKQVTLQGATASGKYAVYYNPTVEGAGLSLSDITFGNNYGYVGFYNDSAHLAVVTLREAATTTLSAPTRALYCESTTAATTLMLIEAVAASFLSNITDFGYVTGAGSLLAVTNISAQAISGGRFLRTSNGGRIVGRQLAQEFFTTGLEIENVGAASEIQITGTIFNSVTNDLLLSHPDAFGAFQGLIDSTKVTVDPDSLIKLNYIDAVNQDIGEVTLGDIFQGDRHDRILPLSRLVRETAPVGTYSGGVITATTGLEISVSAGAGFTQDSADDYMKEVTWSTTPLTLPANTTNYIYITDDGVVSYATSEPDILRNLILGRVATFGASIYFIDRSSIRNNQLATRIEQYQRDAIGPIYSAGSIVVENGTRGLDVSTGTYYFGNTKFIPTGGTAISWVYNYKNGSGGFTTGTQSTVDNAQYDNGTGTLASLTSAYYAKHSLYISGDGAQEKYHLVYSQVEYSSLILAEAGDIPTPPSNFIDGVTLIATIIVQEGQPNLQIQTARPVIGFSATGVSASASHGNLLGLLNDDHTQYLLVNGSRAMTGSLDMGGQSISNLNLVDGVDISAHGSRHLPNGTDPLTTAAPSANLTLATTNSVGLANSLSRSDHSHALDVGLVGDIVTIQPGDTTSAGTSDSIARADHRHALASGTPSSTGTANTEGVSTGVARVDHSHDTVIVNTEVESSTAFTTTSTTDVVITGLTTTPAAGTYLVMVSMEWVKTAGGSPQTSTASLYLAGSPIANTPRSQTYTANAQFQNCKLQTIVAVNGSQAIDVRVNITGGTTLSVNERSLIVLRVGP